jgi:hypothetical protein
MRKLFSIWNLVNNNLIKYPLEFALAGGNKLILTGPSPEQGRGEPDFT